MSELLIRCAFCGSHKVTVETEGPFFAYCRECRASGPVSDDYAGAANGWNRRHQEQEETSSEFERLMK